MIFAVEQKGERMRPIDADAMLARLEEWNTSDSTDKALYNFTLNRILEQPTLKAVPSAEPKIIRCEYCAHRNQYRFPPKYEVKDYCEVHEKVTTLTNFCSWARRRTDE